MKSIYLTVMVFCSLAAFGNTADPMQAFFQKKFLGNSSSTEKVIVRENLECANFGGKWKVTCKNTQNKEILVEQFNCDLIDFGGNSIYLGGIRTESVFLPSKEHSYVGTAANSTNWIDVQKGFNTYTGGLATVSTASSNGTVKTEVFPYSGKSTYEIVDGNIKVAWAIHMKEFTFSDECTGTKVN